MATYKVIQDIEAEDKFVGPLTLKQFIFAMAGAFFGYMNVFALSKGASWALAIFLPPMFFGFFMAIPWSKDQPTDVWFLAKLRFKFKPKVRVWDQAGIQNLVSITVPKKVEKNLTDNLSQKEVKSRLKALAETIDSRGWAVKNATDQAMIMPSYQPVSDRLVNVDILPKQVPELDITSIPDMMDSTGVDSIILQQDTQRKTHLAENMDRVRHGESWQDTQRMPEVTITAPPDDVISPQQAIESRIDEKLLSDQIKAKKLAGNVTYRRMTTIPTHSGPAPSDPQAAQQDDQNDDQTNDDDNQKTGVEKATSSMTEPASPDILNLAQNNDLDVATIARQAKNDKTSENSEVIISLH